MKYIIFISCLIWVSVACTGKKAPLDKEQFTALLIDMHMADGSISVNGGRYSLNEKQNYTYYNAVFDRYDISRAEFDSCMYYYSSQTLLFSKMYEVVIDSLNKRLTDKNIVLAQLRVSDSINLFPRPDTILFNKDSLTVVVEVDSIIPGLYKFATTVKFDTADVGKNNRITAFFLSEDRMDTLPVRRVTLFSDTIKRYYAWSQYVDTSYSRLVVKFAECDNPGKLKYRNGRILGTTLFRPYASDKTVERLKKQLPAKKTGLELLEDERRRLNSPLPR